MLLIDIDKKLEEIPYLKVFSTDSYFKKNIEPIYIEWVENETTILIQAAQKDLNTIYQHAIDHESKQNDLNYKDTKDSIIAAATALLSTSGAVIATPTVLSLSLTAVPATGVLGLLGLTTTAISWPILLVGGTTVLGLSHFGIGKFSNLKSDTIKRLKEQIHESIQDQVLGLNNENSVCNQLQLKIADIAKTLIRDLEI